MKKRAGVVRREWRRWDPQLGDWVVVDVTFQPIDPDHRAIPNGYWIGQNGAEDAWIERRVDDKAEAAWWEAQDALDDLAAERRRAKSLETRIASADEIRRVLYPLLARAEQAVAEDDRR